MEKYNYTYGMKRPWYTIYALVDPKYPDVPRYIGFTDGDIAWRLGRHLGETWGLDSQKELNLKQRWIRALVGNGRMPESIVLYRTNEFDKAILAESVLIKYLWSGITNTKSCGEEKYKKRKNSKEGKLVIENLHKKYKKIDSKYNRIELSTIYPGILRGTGYE
jgi:hypothetical protein